MKVIFNVSSASLYTAAILFLNWSTSSEAAKLPKCAKECIVPSVCTKADFCSTACFGNCLVPPSLDAPPGCSSAMDQQLLLKACKGSFVGDERADTGLIIPSVSRVSTSTVKAGFAASPTAVSESDDMETSRITGDTSLDTSSTKGAAYPLNSTLPTRPRVLLEDDEEAALADSSSGANHLMAKSDIIVVVALLVSVSAYIV